MNLKKIGKVFTSKFVGTGPLSYKKRIYRAAVSQRLRNTALHYMYFHVQCTINYTSGRISVHFVHFVQQTHNSQLVCTYKVQ